MYSVRCGTSQVVTIPQMDKVEFSGMGLEEKGKPIRIGLNDLPP